MFDRADLILQASDGTLFYGRRWPQGAVEGNALPEEDFEALIAGGEAMRWPSPFSLSAKSGAWFLRPVFGDRGRLLDALSERDAVLSIHKEGKGWALAVCESLVPGLRSDWAWESASMARDNLKKGSSEAERYAERAWLMISEVTPRIVALWVFSLRASGKEGKARGILKMEQNTRGGAFRASVEEELRRLEAEIRPVSPPKKLAIPRNPEIYRRQMQALNQEAA